MNEQCRSGDIFDYPYLWEWQHARGETEGRKERPCCLALVMPLKDGTTRLYLSPITTTPPQKGEIALPVPAIEAARAKLDTDRNQWVILSEWNADIWEQSYYLDRRAPARGRFSKAFLQEILCLLRAQLQAGNLAAIPRD